MIEYLKRLKEETPAWLRNHLPGVKPLIADFFASRVVYYPGAYFDGQPVQLFNSTHSAHCFVYVDYCVEKSELLDTFQNHGFRGYEITDIFDYSEEELTPNGWQPHVHPQRTCFSEQCKKDPYCVLFLLNRTEEYGDDYGADRFALLYLKADAIATYDALFANNYYPPPFCLLIEDYGLGCEYARFDKGGLLEEVAIKSDTYPQYYFISQLSRPWSSAKSLNLAPQAGGMHFCKRYLYVNETSR